MIIKLNLMEFTLLVLLSINYSLILLLFKWTFSLFRHSLFISFYSRCLSLLYDLFYCVEELFGESLCYFEENHRTLRACALIWCAWCLR